MVPTLTDHIVLGREQWNDINQIGVLSILYFVGLIENKACEILEESLMGINVCISA